MNQHPGTIEIVDDEQGTSKTVDAASAPESVAFVDGVPVVRVVHSKRGDQHVIRSFAADGTLLSTTFGN